MHYYLIRVFHQRSFLRSDQCRICWGCITSPYRIFCLDAGCSQIPSSLRKQQEIQQQPNLERVYLFWFRLIFWAFLTSKELQSLLYLPPLSQSSSASLALLLRHSVWASLLCAYHLSLASLTLIDKCFFEFPSESIPILHRVYDIHDSINRQSVSRLQVLMVSIELFCCKHWASSDSVLIWDWLHIAGKASFFYSSSDHLFVPLLSWECCCFCVENTHF